MRDGFDGLERAGTLQERVFQRVVFLIILPEEMEKIERVGSVEGAVFKGQKSLQVTFADDFG